MYKRNIVLDFFLPDKQQATMNIPRATILHFLQNETQTVMLSLGSLRTKQLKIRPMIMCPCHSRRFGIFKIYFFAIRYKEMKMQWVERMAHRLSQCGARENQILIPSKESSFSDSSFSFVMYCGGSSMLVEPKMISLLSFEVSL